MTDLFPTAYFGSIFYFRELVNASSPKIEQKEHFIKQTQRTRCEILGANGILSLSIPVIKHSGSKTPMEEVLLSEETNWRKIHWKAIESAYASSPYFDHYGMDVKQLIEQPEINLINFNNKITKTVFEWLHLESNFSLTEQYEVNINGTDFRSFNFEERLSVPYYQQVFTDKESFISNLSILDLIFNEGPLARNWITS